MTRLVQIATLAAVIALFATTALATGENLGPEEQAVADKVSFILQQGEDIVQRRVEYNYDEQGRRSVITELESTNGGMTWEQVERSVYTYSPESVWSKSVVREVSEDGGQNWQLKSSLEHDFDSTGEIVKTVNEKTGIETFSVEYSYNNDGTVAEETRTQDVYLEGFEGEISTRFFYSYDANGNRIEARVEMLGTDGWQLDRISRSEFNEQNLKINEYNYDYLNGENGALDNREIYSYNENGQLTEILTERPSGDGFVPMNSVTKEYDADGNMVRTAVNRFENGELVNWFWKEYDYVNGQLAEIRIGDENGLTERKLYNYENGLITAVDDAPAPSAVTISGNAPNPFNPSTSLTFTLESAGHADMTVYNVQGQSVRTLVSQAMTPGRHTIIWDGRDNAGQTVSAGVYIARLVTDNGMASHKMTLVK